MENIRGPVDTGGLSNAELAAYRDTHMDNLSEADFTKNIPSPFGKYAPSQTFYSLREFDEEPGKNIGTKTLNWGARGSIVGGLWGVSRLIMMDHPTGISAGRYIAVINLLASYIIPLFTFQ